MSLPPPPPPFSSWLFPLLPSCLQAKRMEGEREREREREREGGKGARRKRLSQAGRWRAHRVTAVFFFFLLLLPGFFWWMPPSLFSLPPASGEIEEAFFSPSPSHLVSTTTLPDVMRREGEGDRFKASFLPVTFIPPSPRRCSLSTYRYFPHMLRKSFPFAFDEENLKSRRWL